MHCWAQVWTKGLGPSALDAGVTLHRTRADLAAFIGHQKYNPQHEVPSGLPFLVLITSPEVEKQVAGAILGIHLAANTPGAYQIIGQAAEDYHPGTPDEREDAERKRQEKLLTLQAMTQTLSNESLLTALRLPPWLGNRRGSNG